MNSFQTPQNPVHISQQEDLSSLQNLPVHRADVVVLGSGPAGYSAALYAVRYGNSVRMVSGSMPGGQLTTTTDIENYPGLAQGISGPQLMQAFHQQCLDAGVMFDQDHVVSVDFSKTPLRARAQEAAYEAPVMILATGASAKWLGVPGEEFYKNRGVSACATCDGLLFRGKSVAVIGGGNTCVEEALFLARYVAHVTVIHRRDTLRADAVLQKRLMNQGNVSFAWNKRVLGFWGSGLGYGQEDFLHLLSTRDTSGNAHDSISESDVAACMDQGKAPRLGGVAIQDVAGGAPEILPVQGAFVAIGHNPNTEIFSSWLARDPYGYLLPFRVTSSGGSQDLGQNAGPNVYTPPCPYACPVPGPKTEIPGVFMAGDVCDSYFRQAITAAGAGCQAAIEAQKFLQSL